MKKSNHTKIKNTIILFELLTRQVAADTMRGVEKSPALNLIKEFFKANSLLAKELVLYQTLVNENFANKTKAEQLLKTITQLRRKLNKESLKKQKYELIREIKKNYDIHSFFNTKINDYKLYASIYRIFEGTTVTKAVEVVNSKFVVLEHLNRKNKTTLKEVTVDSVYKEQDEEIRLLAYKLMVDKFNKKYASLSTKQKSVLKEYINNVSNTTTLRDYVVKEALNLRLGLEKELKKVTDKVTKIKLNEVITLTKGYEKVKTVNESSVLSLLLYHELLKELKDANKGA